MINYLRFTWSILYPNADTAPVMLPITNAPPGWSMRSAIAPTATPPLNVAFWISTTWKRFFLIITKKIIFWIYYTLILWHAAEIICISFKYAYSPNKELTINVANVDAHKEMYVLITARCWASPVARAALKLGQ